MTTVSVNQKVSGAFWYPLGVFDLAPGAGTLVELDNNANGKVIADAIRLVPDATQRRVVADAVKIVPNSAEDALYVHADHLGTPQKMTDAAASVVWDATYRPFGEEDGVTGTATNHQRFPGQYKDAESGLHYNYFRDYDPMMGRYLQSDPIGLEDGVNTYVYVNNNPISLIDPLGWYGTQSCAYWPQACTTGGGGGRYECKIAPSVCPAFPNGNKGAGNWAACVRQCLQEKHKDRMPNPNQCSPANNIPPGANASHHAACWRGCLLNPENPYDPNGPDLPDGSPSLFK
jgi:RHS repeat-associated protein